MGIQTGGAYATDGGKRLMNASSPARSQQIKEFLAGCRFGEAQLMPLIERSMAWPESDGDA